MFVYFFGPYIPLNQALGAQHRKWLRQDKSIAYVFAFAGKCENVSLPSSRHFRSSAHEGRAEGQGALEVIIPRFMSISNGHSYKVIMT